MEIKSSTYINILITKQAKCKRFPAGSNISKPSELSQCCHLMKLGQCHRKWFAIVFPLWDSTIKDKELLVSSNGTNSR